MARKNFTIEQANILNAIHTDDAALAGKNFLNIAAYKAHPWYNTGRLFYTKRQYLSNVDKAWYNGYATAKFNTRIFD